MALGDLLYKARHDKGLTRDKAGELAGMDPRKIQRYENGANVPNFETMAILANVYGFSMDEFAALTGVDGLS